MYLDELIENKKRLVQKIKDLYSWKDYYGDIRKELSKANDSYKKDAEKNAKKCFNNIADGLSGLGAIDKSSSELINMAAADDVIDALDSEISILEDKIDTAESQLFSLNASIEEEEAAATNYP